MTPNTNEFRHYIYGPSGSVLMYKRPSNGIGPIAYYLATDHLGSADVITNVVGTEQLNTSFNAFELQTDTSSTQGSLLGDQRLRSFEVGVGFGADLIRGGRVKTFSAASAPLFGLGPTQFSGCAGKK